MSEALAVNGEQPFFSAEQLKMIRDSFLNGASDSEAAVLLEVARLRRLNPLTRQIHFVKRNQWDDRSKSYREVWSHQIGIDGLRAVAERTERYDGQDEPEFTYDNGGKLTFCRVRVYKKGISRPFVGIAHFKEYAQFKKDGSLTKMWEEKPHIMLAKCAEALGLRKGFPEETAGLYIPEEMGRAPDEAAEPVQAPAKRPRAGLAVVEVDTKALAAKRVTADATLSDALSASVGAPVVVPSAAASLESPSEFQVKLLGEILDHCEAGFRHAGHRKNSRAKYEATQKTLLTPAQQTEAEAAYDAAKVGDE